MIVIARFVQRYAGASFEQSCGFDCSRRLISVSYNMSNSRFPAVLKTLDDQIVADTGVIQISIEDKSVDFKSEFIPLYKLGDQLKIVRIQDGIEVVSYVGEVYLSSQHILRLVSVTETVLPAARSVFSYDVDLTGKLIARVLDTSHKRFLFFGKKPRYRETVFDAQIHSIALRGNKIYNALYSGGRANHLFKYAGTAFEGCPA